MRKDKRVMKMNKLIGKGLYEKALELYDPATLLGRKGGNHQDELDASAKRCEADRRDRDVAFGLFLKQSYLSTEGVAGFFLIRHRACAALIRKVSDVGLLYLVDLDTKEETEYVTVPADAAQLPWVADLVFSEPAERGNRSSLDDIIAALRAEHGDEFIEATLSQARRSRFNVMLDEAIQSSDYNFSGKGD